MSKVIVQPVTEGGQRMVKVTVGTAEAVLTPDEARVLVKQLELALKWKTHL